MYIRAYGYNSLQPRCGQDTQHFFSITNGQQSAKVRDIEILTAV